ncbi:MAG TPA: pilus assembly PilX N-terminal domain-containing protein [Gemmatimonadaceae bacterium]|jgi:hypothetical protein
MASRLRARRGVALITALLGVVVITILVAGGFFASTQEFRGGRNQLVEQRSFAVAEYGLNAEISNWDSGRNLVPPAGMAIGAVDARKRYVSGTDTAFVTITRLTPTTYWVISEGKAQMGMNPMESRRRTGAYVRLAYPSLDVSAAVTAAGDIDIRGASTVTGVNTDPTGWGSCGAWSGGEIAAIRVPPGADVDYNASNLPGTQDIEYDPAAADSNTYVRYGTENWNSLVENAEIRLPGGSIGSNILPVGSDTSCTAGPNNWGEPLRTGGGGVTLVPGCYNRFPIIYSSGNLTINANGRGQGILLINGDLKINGNFDFYGIIIARDDIERGTGTATIHGAVFSRDANVGDNSMWAGTQDVLYSRCAVESALRGSAILTRVAQRHWTQLY